MKKIDRIAVMYMIPLYHLNEYVVVLYYLH